MRGDRSDCSDACGAAPALACADGRFLQDVGDRSADHYQFQIQFIRAGLGGLPETSAIKRRNAVPICGCSARSRQGDPTTVDPYETMVVTATTAWVSLLAQKLRLHPRLLASVRVKRFIKLDQTKRTARIPVNTGRPRSSLTLCNLQSTPRITISQRSAAA